MSKSLVEHFLKLGEDLKQATELRPEHTDEESFKKKLNSEVRRILGHHAEQLTWRVHPPSPRAPFGRYDMDAYSATADLEGTEVYLHFTPDLRGRYALEGRWDSQIDPGQHTDVYLIREGEDFAAFLFDMDG